MNSSYMRSQSSAGWEENPEVQNRTQDLARRILGELGTPKEWAEILDLKGEFADRTIRCWITGEKPIPNARLIWIADGVDILLKRQRQIELSVFELREILKRGK